jgi:chromatin assembly factor 1 subunit A
LKGGKTPKRHFSDKTLSALSKHIRHELMPTQDEDEEYDNSPALAALPLSAVEIAIKCVVQRNNYGLDGIGGTRAPAALCVWRWEVKEQHRDWLPKNAREKAEIRAAERVQVSAMGCTALLVH